MSEWTDATPREHEPLLEHDDAVEHAAGCQANPHDTRVGGRLTQWATNDDEVYYAVGRTSAALPPGAYHVCMNSRDEVMFKHFGIDTTGLMRLPDTKSDEILAEIEKFWTRSQRFRRFRIVQRRGILIVGPSGCGKTSTSKMFCVDVVKRGGIVLPYVKPHLLIAGLSLFRSIQPETPIVVMMEDIDEIVSRGNHSDMLNMLDGVYAEFSRVVFVATTNYPERLERRITNRPSRFDCVITMEHPIFETRKLYFESIINGAIPLSELTGGPSETEVVADVGLGAFDVERAAMDTDGLGFSSLKELFTAVMVLDVPYDVALQKVRTMAEQELPDGDTMEKSVRRGSIGFSRRPPIDHRKTIADRTANGGEVGW